ncbi:MAG: dTDP-4-dehydrorhamnose reductase [Verrucomicrobiae bacterium]|nr:dTDP-4-dehydrorhamnose reductase [Verrucomicrobiae bacterium]MCP5539254.1 dTDP-4-dehydrorhamnose reductase [Akkermansiaceae bacterium]
MKQPIAIVGANGRLGRALLEECRRRGHPVAPLTRHDLDLAWSRRKIHEALESCRDSRLLLLAAGNTNVDVCEHEPETAEQLNCLAVEHIAQWCAANGTRLVNFSSDYVFDGEKDSPYREDDPAHPLSVYGRSKVDGEIATLEASPDNLVVRLQWLFGPGKPLATPDWAVALAVENDTLNIVGDRVGAPSYTRDIAAALEPLFFDPRATGILHLSNAGSCSWLEWARFCVECAADCGVPVRARNLTGVSMEDVFGDRATRPRYTVFSLEKYRDLTGREMPDWRGSVREYIRDFVAPRFL